MNRHEGLTVQLVDRDCKPVGIAGVEIDIQFYLQGRLRYTFTLGRTDDNGTVQTQLSDLERQRQENGHVFLMDYNTTLEECDSGVGITVPSVEQLAERERARKKWWPDKLATPESSNGALRCPEQKFQLGKTASNQFNLVCEKVGAG